MTMADKQTFTATATTTQGRTGSTGVVVVRSFDSYPAAQHAVDSLADRSFPVESLAVVARDLVMVEQVTGRRTIWRAGAEGAWSGAFVGALLGFFFGLFDWVEPLVSAVVLALWGIVLGAAIGGIMGATGHWALRGRRDFSSVKGWEAGRYDLVADADTAAEARAMLSSPGGR
jgi:ascorbate-specific PTS system EIIC-type component UlaA